MTANLMRMERRARPSRLGSSGFDLEPAGAPVVDPVLEPRGLGAFLAEKTYRVDRHDAVGAPAVGDDLLVPGQLREEALEL